VTKAAVPHVFYSSTIWRKTEAVVRKVTKQGLKGLEASAIGLTLVGYIAGGFLLGQWLDGHFKTSFWMPVLVLFGTGAGFRDIIKLVSVMSKRAKEDSSDRAVRRPEPVAQKAVVPEAEDQRPKPRFFEVPAPPKASFDKTAGDKVEKTKSVVDDEQTAIEKLLADAETGEPPDNRD